MLPRTSLPSIPSFDGSLVKYTHKLINNTLWKYDPYYTHEDLIQEAYEVYARCVRTYSDTVDNPAWFMSLYKKALHNRFIDISISCTKNRSEVSCIQDPETQEAADILDHVAAAPNCYVELEDLINKAPRPVRQALSLFTVHPELLEGIEAAWKEAGKKKVFQNEHLCRLLGYDPIEIDIEALLRQYITTE